MAASVLNSEHAIEVSVYVVDAFIAMREAAANTRELARRLDELERSLGARLAKHDQAISEILGAIRALKRMAKTQLARLYCVEVKVLNYGKSTLPPGACRRPNLK